jgi:chitin synthase
MVGGLQMGWHTDAIAVLIILIIIACGYGLICLYTSQDFQLMTAKVLTIAFSLLMSATFIGILIQVATNPQGDTKPTSKPGTTVKP